MLVIIQNAKTGVLVYLKLLTQNTRNMHYLAEIYVTPVRQSNIFLNLPILNLPFQTYQVSCILVSKLNSFLFKKNKKQIFHTYFTRQSCYQHSLPQKAAKKQKKKYAKLGEEWEKECTCLQSWSKYFRLTVWEKFNLYFSRVFCQY